MFMLDCAIVSELKKLVGTGIFSGVTTNPILLKKAGIKSAHLEDLYQELKDLGFEKIFFQAVGETASELLDSAQKVLALGREVIVKIPAIRAGYETIAELANARQRILLTAVYHPSQAIVAKDFNCWGIAPYVGRLSDLGYVALDSVTSMVKILEGSQTRILAASLREVDVLAALAALGVQDFTMNPEVAWQLVNNPHSCAAAADFLEASR